MLFLPGIKLNLDFSKLFFGSHFLLITDALVLSPPLPLSGFFLPFFFLHFPLSSSTSKMAAAFISLLTLLTVTLVSAESSVTSLFIPDVEGTALVASIISQVRPAPLIHTASTHLVGYIECRHDDL